MPWSNQGGGGGRKGGGNGGGPWGQGGGGGSGQPPDLDEILRRGQDRMKQVIGGGRGGGGVPGPFLFLLGMLAIAAIGVYGFFFRVNPDELGIVMRFGEEPRASAIATEQ